MTLSTEITLIKICEGRPSKPVSYRGSLHFPGSRLVFTGERWQSLDLCIHAQQLRWRSAERDEYFKDWEKAKRKKND